MKNTILSLLLLLSIASVAAASDEEQIKSNLLNMWAALEAGNIEEYAKYVHPDYTLFGEGDVYLAEGKALELRSMEDWVGRAKNVHTEMHDASVTVRGDAAWMTYYWTDAGYTDEGRFTSRGKSTRIFVRENGVWLCIHGHFTTVE
ncbi:MAG: nuclear transport factor 2 family protein [Pseudomonadota bacterium]